MTAKLRTLQPNAETGGGAYTSVEDLYRPRWKWDTVVWGTHCVDCYPGTCPFRV